MTLEERLRRKIQPLAPKGSPWDKVADAVMITSMNVLIMLRDDAKENNPSAPEYHQQLQAVIETMPGTIKEVREIDIGRRKN